MATLNVRLDDKLKKEAYAVLEKLDMTPTEAVRLLFQYIAENGRMPVKKYDHQRWRSGVITHRSRTAGKPTAGG